MSRSRWLDVSVPLRNGMVHWPSDTPPAFERVQKMADGAPYNLSRLSVSAHLGTHMDAPLHFIAGRPGIDLLPLDATVGPARVIEIRHPEAVTVAELRPHRIRRGDRILFKTRNSARCWRTDAFVEDFVYIAEDAAHLLAERHVRLVGIDYLSVSGFHEDAARTHRTLLGAGIWVVEGLNLSKVKPGIYDLVCLPLRIVDGDGAPARAILRSRPASGSRLRTQGRFGPKAMSREP